jgi:hypothetical protein
VPNPDENFESLVNAGMIIGELPPAHRAVVDELSKQEVDTLVSVYQRLSEADTAEGHMAIPGERAAFVSLIVI